MTDIPEDVMKAAREAAIYISGGSLRENTRLIADAIMAERERPITVRALEWTDDPCPAAKCVFGHYVVNKNYADVDLLVGYGRASATGIGRIHLEVGATESDLKSAAQSDFEARIRSELV